MLSEFPIFSISSEIDFNSIALNLFRYQHRNCPIYRTFCDHLQVDTSQVRRVQEIPFLPIDFFKSDPVLCSEEEVEMIFTSSGTTGQQTSKHLVSDLDLYRQSFRRGFSRLYGPVEDYVVLALLPSYLERKGSSLVYMVQDLIDQSGHSESGFYLNDLVSLAEKLKELEARSQKTLLIGVSFALLDLAARFNFNLKHTIVMETGGMKGRRKEMIREELHDHLRKSFGTPVIHSEYGMTELLSQAYATGDGLFQCPPWMKIFIRDPEDPFRFLTQGKTGGINVIDLANMHSCAFIATQDLGRKQTDEKTAILGRFDHSDIRGCNLMVL